MKHTRPTRCRLAWLAAVSVASLAGIAALAVLAAEALPEWARAAVVSGLGIKCALAVLVGLAAFGGVVAAMVRSGGAGRWARVGRFNADQDGTAALEMVILFPIGLMVLLIVTQSALLFNANVVVHYSAFSAARVATTVVPLEIGEETQNLVHNPDYGGNPPSVKLEMLRRAAVLAILPVAAYMETTGTGDGSIVEDHTSGAFNAYGEDEEDWFHRIQPQYAYADEFTTLDLAQPAHWRDGDPHADCPYHHRRRGEWNPLVPGQYDWVRFCPYWEERMDYWWWEDLIVRVKHKFALQVPYAGALMKDADGEMEVAGEKVYFTEIKAIGKLSNEGGRELRPEDT